MTGGIRNIRHIQGGESSLVDDIVVMYLGCDKDQWRWRSKCMSYVVLRGGIQ